jgi:hypothetical protein
MFEVKFDQAVFERKAKQLQGALDQVPFALSQALNAAVKNARQVLVLNTWPSHVTQRNASFIGRALRTEFSTKRNLRVEIYDDLGRASLSLHADGGVKRAKKRLAIPPGGTVTRTGRGVRKNQTPRSIIDRTPKRALRVTPQGIFVGKGGRLQLKYAFKQQARQPADVPFRDDFETTMRAELRVSFPAALARAMKSRRA